MFVCTAMNLRNMTLQGVARSEQLIYNLNVSMSHGNMCLQRIARPEMKSNLNEKPICDF